MNLLSGDRWQTNQKIQKTAEMRFDHPLLSDQREVFLISSCRQMALRAVDVPVVTRNSCPSYSEIQKTAKIHTHFRYIDRFVDFPVVVQHRGPTIQRLRRFSQRQYLDQEMTCPEGTTQPDASKTADVSRNQLLVRQDVLVSSRRLLPPNRKSGHRWRRHRVYRRRSCKSNGSDDGTSEQVLP